MPDTKTIAVRLTSEVSEKLDELARSTQRSRSSLAAEAIAEYVDPNAWQVAEIEKAVGEADGNKGTSYLITRRLRFPDWVEATRPSSFFGQGAHAGPVEAWGPGAPDRRELSMMSPYFLRCTSFLAWLYLDRLRTAIHAPSLALAGE